MVSVLCVMLCVFFCLFRRGACGGRFKKAGYNETFGDLRVCPLDLAWRPWEACGRHWVDFGHNCGVQRGVCSCLTSIVDTAFDSFSIIRGLIWDNVLQW